MPYFRWGTCMTRPKNALMHHHSSLFEVFKKRISKEDATYLRASKSVNCQGGRRTSG